MRGLGVSVKSPDGAPFGDDAEVRIRKIVGVRPEDHQLGPSTPAAARAVVGRVDGRSEHKYWRMA